MHLTVSVIIPTKNRPGDLALAVSTLFQQTILPIELIIIDQSRSDESQRKIEQIFHDAPAEIWGCVRLRYVRDPTLRG